MPDIKEIYNDLPKKDSKVNKGTKSKDIEKPSSNDWTSRLYDYIDKLEMLYSPGYTEYFDIGKQEMEQGLFLLKMACKDKNFDPSLAIFKLYEKFDEKHKYARENNIRMDELCSDNMDDLILGFKNWTKTCLEE